MRWSNRVVWYEGMFLEPHHFQQNTRFLERLIQMKLSVLQPFSWGFASLKIDKDALRTGKFRLIEGAGIFRDGTAFDFPQHDEPPPPLHLPEGPINDLVVLSVPVAQPGTKAVDDLADGRNRLDTTYFTRDLIEKFGDENTSSGREAETKIAHPRLALTLKQTTSHAYSTLGTGFALQNTAPNGVVCDEEYIPPILSVSGNDYLTKKLHLMLGLIKQKGEEVARQISQPSAGGASEVEAVLWLNTVNRFEPLFADLAGAGATDELPIHPRELYKLCLSLAGDLSTFDIGRQRRVRRYAEYNHDDLRSTFHELLSDIHYLLALEPARRAVQIPLHDRPNGLKVGHLSDPQLLKDTYLVLVGRCQLPAERFRSQFPQLAKIAAPSDILGVVGDLRSGIPLSPAQGVPPGVPPYAGFTYFELVPDRSPDPELWRGIEKQQAIAIQVVGSSLPGLEFELWAVFRK